MKYISQSDLSSWLDELAGNTRLIAPRNVSGKILYQPIEQASQLAWGYRLPDLPVKEAFFPTTERLFSMQVNNNGVQLIETLPDEGQVIFGVRPCDARGVEVLDALFIQDSPPDPYYAKRRENTTMIGLACSQMGPNCFCTQLGGGPDDPRGVDLMLKEVNGGYVLQVMTEKGQQLIDSMPGITYYGGRLPEPPRAAPLVIGDPEAIDWDAHFDDEFWQEMSERCLSCRICAYVCPTCRCFDVRDEPISSGDGAYERLRCWDSCARDAYRQIAGGHNPRAVKGERLRNRFFCKFNYYPQQYGTPMAMACTGCGRCIEACPVNIDITEILAHLLEVTL
jgi:ferredoxin